MAIPNRLLINSPRLRRNTDPDVNMEAEVVVVYYGISLDCSLKILCYVRRIASCSRPSVASREVTQPIRAACSGYDIGHVS